MMIFFSILLLNGNKDCIILHIHNTTTRNFSTLFNPFYSNIHYIPFIIIIILLVFHAYSLVSLFIFYFHSTHTLSSNILRLLTQRVWPMLLFHLIFLLLWTSFTSSFASSSHTIKMNINTRSDFYCRSKWHLFIQFSIDTRYFNNSDLNVRVSSGQWEVSRLDPTRNQFSNIIYFLIPFTRRYFLLKIFGFKITCRECVEM